MRAKDCEASETMQATDQSNRIESNAVTRGETPVNDSRVSNPPCHDSFSGSVIAGGLEADAAEDESIAEQRRRDALARIARRAEELEAAKELAAIEREERAAAMAMQVELERSFAADGGECQKAGVV